MSGRRQKSESVFSVFHYNVQCLRNKAHQIEAFLFDKNYDILCINEHWLSNDEIKCINICNFVNVSDFSRKFRSHGGVAVYARLSTVSVCSLPFDIASLSIEIDFETAGAICNGVQVVTIYRSPQGDYDRFLNRLDMLLKKLNMSKGVVLTGDFNVHFESSCRRAKLLCDLCTSYGLTKTVDGETRLVSITFSLILVVIVGLLPLLSRVSLITGRLFLSILHLLHQWVTGRGRDIAQ